MYTHTLAGSVVPFAPVKDSQLQGRKVEVVESKSILQWLIDLIMGCFSKKQPASVKQEPAIVAPKTPVIAELPSETESSSASPRLTETPSSPSISDLGPEQVVKRPSRHSVLMRRHLQLLAQDPHHIRDRFLMLVVGRPTFDSTRNTLYKPRATVARLDLIPLAMEMPDHFYKYYRQDPHFYHAWADAFGYQLPFDLR